MKTTISVLFMLMLCSFLSCQEDKKKERVANISHQKYDSVHPFELENATKDELTRLYVPPQRIVWKSDDTDNYVANEKVLLRKGTGQVDLETSDLLVLNAKDGHRPSILLDFGKELHGGIRLVASFNSIGKPVRVRVRLGESVQEAMSDQPYGEFNATNDHAIRDFEIQVPWLGKIEVGDSGFRFARIDLLQEGVELKIKEINAILIYRDIPYLGSFESDNARLNEIWQTGAYTVHLNMQDYLWDGIKRDRLVWLGDMHPEVMTIGSVFGYNKVVPKSLDLGREITKLPKWMNGISSYSMWWIIIHHQWYLNYGNLDYLEEQKSYMLKLLKQLIGKTKGGAENFKEGRFLDWPSVGNDKAIHAGLQSLLVMALEQGGELCKVLQEDKLALECVAKANELKQYVPEHNFSKQAAALLVLSGIAKPEQMANEVLLKDGVKGLSTFYGYYVLQALARAGNYTEAMDLMSEYWGGMLDMGATTFWEEFELEEKEISGRIDQLLPSDLKDYHGETGAHCYVGYRRSLCHGWASGPTAWLSEHVLGIQILEPGMKKIKIEPHLGNLKWVKGTFPTPYGVIKVHHKKTTNQEVVSEIEVPEGIELIK